MNDKNILELLKIELNNNNLFKSIFISAIENHNTKNEEYFNILNTLNEAYSYINFTYIIYYIDAIIQKRLNDIINLETVSKAIEILMIKE